MPLREYLCHDCRRVYTYLTATTGDERRPLCPRCGGADLERQLSTFARTQRRKEPLAAIPAQPGDPPKAGLEQARHGRDGEPVEHDEGLYPIWEHCAADGASPADDPDLRPTRRTVQEGMGGEGPRPPGPVILVRHQRDEG